jgi:hypothetical protein
MRRIKVENIKVMPYEDKFEIVMDNIKFAESLAADFIEEHLGYAAKTELQRLYRKGISDIQEDASFEEKYEAAYKNWIWIAKSDFKFIRDRMGEAGIELFEGADVEALKRKNASPSLYMLSFIRAISPGAAFKMTAKEFAYQLQWLTPFYVEELDNRQAVYVIPQCKILDYPETIDLCQIGCQSIYPQWVAEQFKASMKFTPQGHSCTCCLTPLH